MRTLLGLNGVLSAACRIGISACRLGLVSASPCSGVLLCVSQVDGWLSSPPARRTGIVPRGRLHLESGHSVG